MQIEVIFYWNGHWHELRLWKKNSEVTRILFYANN